MCMYDLGLSENLQPRKTMSGADSSIFITGGGGGGKGAQKIMAGILEGLLTLVSDSLWNCSYLFYGTPCVNTFITF